MIEAKQLQRIIEAALFASDRPLTVNQLCQLFSDPQPTSQEVKAILAELGTIYADRGLQLTQVASGYCFRVSADLGPWVSRLWEHKPPRYSRALMETLAVIAYRQPVTRGDIEHIRGVSVSPGSIKTLLERDWIRIVGHREVPGRPELMATTSHFLDYFGLRSIDDLPSLIPLKEIESLESDLPQAEQEQLVLLEMKTAAASVLCLTAKSQSQESEAN